MSSICSWNCRKVASASRRRDRRRAAASRSPRRARRPAANRPHVDERDAARRGPVQQAERHVAVGQRPGFAQRVDEAIVWRRRRHGIAVRELPIGEAERDRGDPVAEVRVVGQQVRIDHRLDQPELHALDDRPDVARRGRVAQPAHRRAALPALGARHGQHVDAFADDVDAGPLLVADLEHRGRRRTDAMATPRARD